MSLPGLRTYAIIPIKYDFVEVKKSKNLFTGQVIDKYYFTKEAKEKIIDNIKKEYFQPIYVKELYDTVVTQEIENFLFVTKFFDPLGYIVPIPPQTRIQVHPPIPPQAPRNENIENENENIENENENTEKKSYPAAVVRVSGTLRPDRFNRADFDSIVNSLKFMMPAGEAIMNVTVNESNLPSILPRNLVKQIQKFGPSVKRKNPIAKLANNNANNTRSHKRAKLARGGKRRRTRRRQTRRKN